MNVSFFKLLQHASKLRSMLLQIP